MNITTINEARELGLKTYFTGKPCARGHVAERYTKKRACVLCVREDSYRRSLTNKVKKQNAAYKKTSQYKTKQKEYRRKPDVMRRETEAQKARYHKDVCASRQSSNEWKRKNSEKVSEQNSSHYRRNREYHRVKNVAFREANPSYYRLKNSEKRKGLKDRTPAFFGELDQLTVSEAHELAAKRERETGIKWHVDHIVPLLGKLVSGLHIFNNLQVIPACINLSKHNKFKVT